MTEQELWDITKLNVKKINEWHKKFTARLDSIESELEGLKQMIKQSETKPEEVTEAT